MKYIIRSDIMYARKEPLLNTEQDQLAYAMFLQAEVAAEAGDVEGSIALFKKAIRLSLAMAQMMGLA